MVDSFSALKKSSSSSLKRLSEEVSKLDTSKSGKTEDNRFWQPEVSKDGNGYAVIRFLPAPPSEDLPFVRIWNHGFKGTNGWYIENSLTTLGQPDPVSELNSRLWNSGIEKDKEIVRQQKRKLTYISNILVIKDQAHPENEGKVFLYKYGKKIFDKINSVMNPEYEDETPFNPFDPWEGANFKIKIRTVEGYRNYDKSEFDAAAPISSNDSEIEAIWKQQHSLKAFLDPSNFKSYAELKARLDLVRGVTEKPGTRNKMDDVDEEEQVAAAPAFKSKPAPAPKAAATDDEDDDLSFFKSLADDD